MALSFRANQESEQDVMLDINTTPLVDVMLVLIIMLIITIPVQLHQLSLSGVDPQQQTAKLRSSEPVTLELGADGSMRWAGRLLADRAELEQVMMQFAATPEPPQLLLRPEPRVAYRHLAAALALAQAQGLTKIGLVDPGQGSPPSR